MSIESEAAAGEKVELPDPLARVKLIARMGWPLAAALVLALAVLGDALRHSIHWGDFPTWLLGITTLLAFLAATFAGVVAYDLLKIEAARDEVASQERREAAADRRQAALDRERAERKRVEDSHLATYERVEQWKADRRAQASKVTAWFAYYERMTGDPVPPNITVPIGSTTWGATVRNASELPIFDVRIMYFRVNDPRDGRPWTATEVYDSVDIIRLIPPGHARNQELPSRVRDQYEIWNDDVCLVGVELTDANGVRWRRDERAVLEEI